MVCANAVRACGGGAIGDRGFVFRVVDAGRVGIPQMGYVESAIVIG